MPPFFDISSAYAWLVMGFLAGLLFYWLVRALLGVDRRRADELASLQGELGDARRALASVTDTSQRLEGERSRLMSEINQLSPRASLMPQLERQLAEARHSASTAAQALEEANQRYAAEAQKAKADLAKFRAETETKGKAVAQYETEYAKLHTAHQALAKDLEAKSSLIAKLQSDYDAAARQAQDAVQLRSELGSARSEILSLKSDVAARTAAAQSVKDDMARLSSDRDARLQQAQAEIAKLRADAERSEGLSGEVARLQAALAAAPKQDLSATVAGLTAEVARLKSELAVAPREDYSADVRRLSGDVERLSEQLEQTRADERKAAMDLYAARTDLQQVRTALEETSQLLAARGGEIEQLRSRLAAMPDVDSYKRFKDALDAANRIAAGLPERG